MTTTPMWKTFKFKSLYIPSAWDSQTLIINSKKLKIWPLCKFMQILWKRKCHHWICHTNLPLNRLQYHGKHIWSKNRQGISFMQIYANLWKSHQKYKVTIEVFTPNWPMKWFQYWRKCSLSLFSLYFLLNFPAFFSDFTQ